MQSIFAHRNPPPKKTKHYRRFRPYIREDFHQCCGFCLLHEVWARGRENFELDHFKPKSKFPELELEYTNLYYACHACNKAKRDTWPTEELKEQGYHFVDFCTEDYSSNFRDENGRWQAISYAGAYTIEKLRLNSPDLVSTRRIIANYLQQLGEPPIDWDKPLLFQIKVILEAVEQADRTNRM